jgi:hypothetical protein
MSRTLVTAQMLADLHRAGQSIALPKSALVTPAARDWLRDHAVPVAWTDAPADGADADGSLRIVIDLGSPGMRSLFAALERKLGTVETIDPSEKAGGPIPAVRKLCADVAGGRATRGLVFLDDAALPVCLANKVPGVRAALGTTLPAVEQAVRQVAINVLVIEPSRLTVHQIRQMVDRFVTLVPGEAARAALEAVVALEGGRDANR